MKAVLLAVCACVPLASCAAEGRVLPPCVDEQTTSSVVDAGVAPVVLAAGDIAACESRHRSEATARVLDQLDGTVLALGDTAYPSGTVDDFLDCYDPTWGRHRERTRPCPGNHEYRTPYAAGYYRYFCGVAGEPYRGYYSFDVGAWHVVSLNSNCDARWNDVSCDADGAQARWLREDLAAHPTKCTLAFWHHPRFSSGEHGGDASMAPLFEILYEADVELLLSGHDHDYERFAPQTPEGQLDEARGVVQFVVGTGGKEARPLEAIQPHSQVQRTDLYGVLALTLYPTSYEYRFISVDGSGFADSGSGRCH